MRKFFQVSAEDAKSVRAIYDKTEEDIKECVDIIKEWMAKQPHLPKECDDARIGRILLRNKFRMEQTKKKLEAYYTMRGLYPEYQHKLLGSLPLMQKTLQSIVWYPLPKLTPNKERLYYLRVNPDDSLYDVQNAMCYIILATELSLTHDYAVGDCIIIDHLGFNMNHFKKFSPTVLNNSINLHQEAYSGRVTKVHVLNAPPFLQLLLTFMKGIISAKLFGKIVIHNDLSTLYDEIPKDCLPIDLGGSQTLAQTMHDEFGKAVIENMNFLAKQAKVVSNESLRIGEVVRNDNFGMDGTFKKLNFD